MKKIFKIIICILLIDLIIFGYLYFKKIYPIKDENNYVNSHSRIHPYLETIKISNIDNDLIELFESLDITENQNVYEFINSDFYKKFFNDEIIILVPRVSKQYRGNGFIYFKGVYEDNKSEELLDYFSKKDELEKFLKRESIHIRFSENNKNSISLIPGKTDNSITLCITTYLTTTNDGELDIKDNFSKYYFEKNIIARRKIEKILNEQYKKIGIMILITDFILFFIISLFIYIRNKQIKNKATI